MEANETKREVRVGEMRRSREPMADGKRYIIYYTFGEPTGGQPEASLTGGKPAENEPKSTGGDGK